MDTDNFLKYKALSILSSLLMTQGDVSFFINLCDLSSKRKNPTTKFMNLVKTQLQNVDGVYEKVFALKNHGYTLAQHDETRHEG